MQEEKNDLSDSSSNITDNEQVDELVLPTIQRRASTFGTQSPSKTRETAQYIMPDDFMLSMRNYVVQISVTFLYFI